MGDQTPPSARVPMQQPLMPAAVPADHSKDHRLDKLILGAAGVIVTVAIAVASWVFGGLHERVDKNEDKIHQLELKIVEQKNTIERTSESNRKQWELINANGQRISELKGAVDRHHSQ